MGNTPRIPTSWYSHPYVIPSPWVWTGPSDWPLTNRIGQKCWDDTSLISYTKHSRLLADPLAGFDEASLSAGKAHVARNWGWPPAKSQLGTEALSPNTFKKLNPANHDGSVLGSQSFPSETTAVVHILIAAQGRSWTRGLSWEIHVWYWKKKTAVRKAEKESFLLFSVALATSGSATYQ